MKVTVLVPFRDKYDHKVVYAPGEVREFDNDRAAALAARGLVRISDNAGSDRVSVGKLKGKFAKKDKEISAEARDNE